MDISGIKWSSNVGVATKNSLLQQSTSSQYNDINTNAPISSLALKLDEAQRSIDSTTLNQKTLSWDDHKALLNTNINRNEVSSAKWEFEHLSKSKLEIIALDTSDVFSGSEKIAAYEKWHTLDQAELFSLKRGSLDNESAANAMLSFEEGLLSHINSFSSFSKAMVSDEYSSQATSQFESILNEQGLANNKDESQSEYYYGIMVEDIFEGNEPEVQSGVDGMSLSNIMKSNYEFLTQEDKALLADVYEYADKNDIDFKYIQQLASDLGNYRKHDNGKILDNFNNGHFNIEGNQLTVSFTDKDQMTIYSLLDNDGLPSSAIDKGFISFITEPGMGALSHIGSYQFLQHIVEATTGIETSVSADEFKVFEGYPSIDDRYVITASEESFPRPKPDIVCKNGVCEVTEQGRNNNITLEQGGSTFMPAFDLKSESIESLWQLRMNTETQEKSWFRWLKND